MAIAPIAGEDGRITHIVTVLTDITERKRMEHMASQQGTILEMIATGRPLSEVLAAILTMMRQQMPGMGCSFVLPDELGGLPSASAPLAGCSQPIRSRHGEVLGAVVLSSSEQSLTPDERQLLELAAHLIGIALERERAEESLRQRERMAALKIETGAILTTRLSSPCTLSRCAEALVRHLRIAFAGIWLLNEADHTLELAASAGVSANLLGSYGRIPIGSPLKISRIAQDRKPYLTNRVLQENWATDTALAWAKREGMVSFTGHPLIADDRVIGVMAMFSRHPLPDHMAEELEPLAGGIARFIVRAEAEERLIRQNRDLEQRLAERTRELLEANAQLKRQIADRLQAEKEREQYAADRSLLLESIGEGIFGIDVNGTCTFINTAGARRLGYEPKELIGVLMHGLIHHSRADGSPYSPLECPILNALQTGVGGRAHDEVLWSRAGVALPVDLSFHPIIEEGRISGAVVVFSDLSERKRTEEALVRTRAAESLIKNAPDPLFVADRHGTILKANDAVAQLLGLPAGDAVEQSMARFLFPEEMQNLTAALCEAAERGTVRNVRLTIHTAGGEVVPTLLNASAWRDSGGHVTGIVGILRDIRAYEQVVRELEKSKEQLIDKIIDLETFHDIAVDRELKLIEMEKEVKVLRARLASREGLAK